MCEVLKREDERDFSCGICLEMMGWDRLPRVLPCGHSFCSSCLEKVIGPSPPPVSSCPLPPSQTGGPVAPPKKAKSTSSVSGSSPPLPFLARRRNSVVNVGNCCCPICRKIFECLSVESFDVNHLIVDTVDRLVSSNLLSLFPLSPLPEEMKRECVNFENCEEKTDMYCPKCEKFICDSCDSAHTSSIFTRDHRRQQYQRNLENTTTSSSSSSTNSQASFCLEPGHFSEVVSAFCFECSSFVCVRCILGSHSRHQDKVSPVDESIWIRQKQVVKIGEKLEQRLNKVKRSKKVNEEEVKELEHKLKELEDNLVEKKAEGKEIELEIEDLRMRCDTIERLSKTPKGRLILNEKVFSTLVQTATDLVDFGDEFDSVMGAGPKKISALKKGVVCSDRTIQFVSSFDVDRISCNPYGLCLNRAGNFVVADFKGKKVRIFRREGTLVQSFGTDDIFRGPMDVAVGADDQIFVVDYSKDCVVVLSKDGNLIKSFGSRGSGPGQFNSPSGVTVDDQGRIIVVEQGNHRLQVFSGDGSFIRCIGTKGSAEGEFQQPRCVAIDHEGHLVISDCLNHRIQVMDIEGNFLRTFGAAQSYYSPRLNEPKGIAVDGKGQIIVVEYGNKRVSVFDKEGNFLYLFGSDYGFGQFKRPWGVFVDSVGHLVVSDQGKASIELWK